MKNNNLSFFILMMSIVTLQANARVDNLVINPGFERSANAIPDWVIKGPVATMQPITGLDHIIKYSGSASLRMESKNVNGQGSAVQVIPVQSNLTYEFKVRFKTKNVVSIDKSIMIRIKWFKGDENIGYHYIYDIASESNGWSLATDKIKAIEGADHAEISLVFRWSTGTVWWDEISMASCDPLPSRNVNVATVYVRPPGPTIEKNIELLSELLDQAGKQGVQIICLPEGWTTNNTGVAMQKNEVNTLDGSASKMMAAKAKQYGMYIVSGLYSWVGDTLNNVAVLYNKKGEIQSVYKKVQLPDSEAESGAVPGNELPVFDTDFGRIGILICWDYAFPEVPRALALKGAEILFCPIAGDVRGDDTWKVIARSRAVDNGVYFVTAIYDGHSVIINPGGEVLEESGVQNSLLTHTVDLNFSPAWDWVGNAGRGQWKGVWRKDRRSDIFSEIGHYQTSSK